MALAQLGTQVRPYRDYLTPALHRRFNRASKYTLLLCYAIACWMGEWANPLWSFFPLGLTGIRTLLLFLSALSVYVLRVSQWHVGPRQTPTQAQTFTKYFFRLSTVVTLLAYAFSAMIFVETYIWSRGPKDRLAFIEAGRMHERFRLNERPLYLRYCFYLLAAAQSVVHLWRDYDKIDVPAMKPKKDRGDAAPARRASKPRHVLIKEFKGMATKSSSLVATIAVVGFIVYFPITRNLIWSYYYSLGRYLWSLSKTSTPTGLAPFLPLCLMFITEGTLLVLLWEFVNKTFDVYIAQEPLKNDNPITNDSKDPNGSLLNGLKSKKDTVKAIAFWELALITDAFPDRRKTLYSEMDRKKAPTHEQVTDLCLGELKFLIERLSLGLDPAYNPVAGDGKEQSAVPVNLVPRISQPLKDDKAIAAPPPKPNSRLEHFEAATADLAKSHSAPGNAQKAYSREAINKGLSKAQEGAKEAESLFTTYYNKFVSSSVGALFRQSIQRTASIVVLGAPYSRISSICNAVTSLVNLAVSSLSEDSLGRFHEGIPAVVRVLTIALNKIDEYMETVPIHPSDVETLAKLEAERRKVPEVDEVRECLREGLERILGSFNEYLSSMGLSRLEIMEAKKAASAKKAPEMIQAGGK
ncbi:hypothetical protein COCSADRAFT_196339 [Bipolaris sorokiniana ND90Pr]|uniref:Nucleoporin NDC1 n=1 Tax=Cochliobolus sativus (strain ND90Pr / ATCC 201652) TaxID=665912 RepID=M2T1J0_COCSN|nr:uncharacterized protein COCSADRAFT_196339 [Bipolaris sorokiniana ND90Pr]EMD68385.1 hypothetical protein COCSADRAFT_196339 [Bipolaris sorokiniana ND90Pr]